MGRPINVKKYAGPINGSVTQLIAYANLSGTANVAVGLIQQKGSRKFHVETAAGAEAICSFVNAAPALCAVGQMSMVATLPSLVTFYVRKITNHWVYDWAGNRYSWTITAGNAIQAVLRQG